jgi:glutamate-1-semialdehyde 2,1-aminomutase
MERTRVTEHVAHMGGRAQRIWSEAAEKHGLPLVEDEHYPCLSHFKFDHEEPDSLRTLYTQWMLDRGFLAGPQFSPTLAHTDAILDMFAEAVDEVFGLIAETVAAGTIEDDLRGPVAHSGFRRLT